MRLRRINRFRLKIELPEPVVEEVKPVIKKERVVKPITDEGAYRLAAAILVDAYNSYTESLKTIMKLRTYAEKVIPIVRAWDKYQLEKLEVLQIKRLVKVREDHYTSDEELERIENFKTLKKPQKPTSYQINKMNKYFEAEREKGICEAFYKSDNYVILSLDKGPKGEELIEEIKRKVGWDGLE